MKNNLKNETMIPSTREESIELIIQNFLESDKQTLKLALFPQEVSQLEETCPEIYIQKGADIYKLQNGLSNYNIFKY